DNSTLDVRDTVMRRVGEGPYIENSNGIIEHCYFEDMYIGQALPTSSGSGGVIFRCNEAYGCFESGVGAETVSGDLLIEDNYCENLRFSGISTYVASSAGSARILRNTIRAPGNPAGFLFRGHNVTALLNSTAGGSVYGLQLTADVENYRFERNFITGSTSKAAALTPAAGGAFNYNLVLDNQDTVLVTAGTHEFIGNYFDGNGPVAPGHYTLFVRADDPRSRATASALSWNTFLSPSGEAVWVDGSPAPEAADNFWGHASGPNLNGTGSPGSGGLVHGITFTPWLTSSPTEQGFVDGLTVEPSQELITDYGNPGLGVRGHMKSPQSFPTDSSAAVWLSALDPAGTTGFPPFEGANVLFINAVHDARYTIRGGSVTLALDQALLVRYGITDDPPLVFVRDDDAEAWLPLEAEKTGVEYRVELPMHSATLAVTGSPAALRGVLDGPPVPGGQDHNGDGVLDAADIVG
ncbi:hypothetical protein HZA57_08450, partial [Candidatus Poribacteria bacterium]|nr:hypothetical protein [Candidatus Poribacteria bacterium]